MGEFENFMKNVKDGNLNNVVNDFQPDFLEKSDDSDKCRPIHLACVYGHLQIVKFLLQNNCSLDCEDKWKMQPIHFACKNGHLEIVKVLLQNNCSIECENDWKKRPIHFACDNGHIEIVKFLLQNECNIECENDSKNRPIHLACKNGHLNIVKFLLQNECNIECEDQWKRRPIHLACKSGNLEIVKYLFHNRCELDCRTQDGKTPFEMAKDWGYSSCANFLTHEIDNGEKIFDCVKRNDSQMLHTLYNPAILTSEDREVRKKMYYTHSFSGNLQTGLSLLEVALELKANDIVLYFLNQMVNVEEVSSIEIYMKNCSRPNAIQLIQECLLYRSIRFHYADGFHMSNLARTINEPKKLVKISFLEVAAEYGCSAFINLLLKKSIYNEEEWTKAKELAIQKGYDEIAEAISNRQGLLRKRADKNFTCLHSAVCDNDPDLMKYILDKNLVIPDSNNEIVGTSLALAHMMCYDKCIEILEKFNVDVNTENKYSQSPLHEAIASGMIDHCWYLIERANDIDKPGFMGFTGLQCAVIKGCEKLCDHLVKKGANCVRYVENLQQSSIHDAVLPISKRENAVTLCMKIHETIYPCFLEKLDLDMLRCSDGDGNSLLHMAVKTLKPDLCNTLIKSGSSVDAINEHGNSPLLELFSNVDNQHDNVEKVIATLNIWVEIGIDVNKIPKSGITVIQGASQWNSERLMVSLLSKQHQVTCVTEADFKLAFTKHWFEYAATLISLMTVDSLQLFITNEIFHLTISHGDRKLLMSLFLKANPKVQQSVIEDLLDHFASIDEYDDFLNLLNTEIAQPKLFINGETLLTSLLKKKNLKYCCSIINCTTNQKFIVLANAIKQTPLQIAIEEELYDLMIPLIFNCDEQLNREFNWHDQLISLFLKLSNSNNNETDRSLLAAIKAIICRGGDIYKEIAGGAPLINHCNRYKEEIKTFQNNERRKEPRDKKICSICFIREVDCAFECGHTFCMDCGTKLYQCAICNSKETKPKKLFFN